MTEETTTFFLAGILIALCFAIGIFMGRGAMRQEVLNALSQDDAQCFGADHCVISGVKWVRTADGWERGVAP